MDCTKFMHGIPLVDSETQSLQAIRALHQTVVSLRTALDKSKSELQELKSKSLTEVEADIFKGTIEKLALENHILRQRVLFTRKLVNNVDNLEETTNIECENGHSNYMDRSTSKTVIQPVGISKKEKVCSTNHKRDELPEKEDNPKVVTKETLKREGSDNAYRDLKEETPLSVQKVNVESENIDKVEIVEKEPERNVSVNAEETFNEDREADSESEELDDIELIFTTEDTKDLPTAQENLVSITDAESWNTLEGTPILLKYTEAQQFDEASEDDRAEGDDSKGNRNQVGKGSEYELEKTWENPVPVETDISKCGIVEEKDLPIASPQKCRRNTLPTPAHRPVILGETLMPGCTKGKVSCRPFRGHEARPCTIGVTTAELESGVARPILVEGKHGSARRESGAQTDITALPSRWRSEGYLAHKVSHNFTTLPSKFTIPPSPLPSPTPHQDDPRKRFHSQSCRDRRSSTERRAHHRLNEESRDTRRTLLSDINFTSMVPELSRSADHLCRDGENVSGIGSMEAGRCLLMGMDLGFNCKYNGLHEEISHPCCNRRSGDGYRMGCHDGGRRGRGICSSRPTTWDCSMRGNSSGLGPGQASWSSIPSTPNASDIEWNAETLRRNPWKMHAAESPIWASSVPTSPTHFHSTVLQSQPSSYSHHQCNRRQSGPPQYYAGRGSMSGWGYDGMLGSGKAKGTIPYSISQTSFSGSFYPRKGSGIHHRQKNRVTFKDSSSSRSYTRPGNSLPDLRDEYSIRGSEEEEESYGWSTSRGRGGNSGSGGDSTDSLIDEAEEYLRRSIDSILTGTDWTRVGCRRQTRRHSDPDPVRELKPPRSAQPFLPKEPKELRPECFAKVILSNGRVVVGRVRYSGILRGAEKEEYIVGVELPCQTGDSDGTFNGIRYFDCNPNRAVFVPFKKVIIAWNT